MTAMIPRLGFWLFRKYVVFSPWNGFDDLFIVVLRHVVFFVVVKNIGVIPALAFNLALLDVPKLLLGLYVPSVQIAIEPSRLLKQLPILVLFYPTDDILSIERVPSDHLAAVLILSLLPELVCSPQVFDDGWLVDIWDAGWRLLHDMLACLTESALGFLLVDVGHVELVDALVAVKETFLVNITSASEQHFQYNILKIY